MWCNVKRVLLLERLGDSVNQWFNWFSSATKMSTIRLCDIYCPRPQSVKLVQIRPPSPRAVFNPSVSSEPPTKPTRRRALSLPSSKKRDKEPKSLQVRFADSLGLELQDVKFFKVGEDPLIPQHVISRLLMSSELASGKSLEFSMPYFKPCFPDNMGSQPNFLKHLRSKTVCLEHVLCSDLGIVGTAQVLNLAFEKRVRVHYSFTNWRTSANTTGTWISSGYRGDSSSEPETDIFSFRLPVPPFILQPGALLEFAICYQVNGCSYWDNNYGNNYRLSCHSYKLTVPKECENSMLHFI